jgi:hypothetical protein
MHRRPLLRLWRSTVRVSRACEREKGADIVHIGRLQRVDLTPPKVTRTRPVCAAPGKNGLVLGLMRALFFGQVVDVKMS